MFRCRNFLYTRNINFQRPGLDVFTTVFTIYISGKKIKRCISMSFKSSGKQKIFSWGSIFELESQKTFPIISKSQPLIRPFHIRKVFISKRVVVASTCYLSRTAFIEVKIWQLVVLDFWNVNIITLLIKIHLLFSIH